MKQPFDPAGTVADPFQRLAPDRELSSITKLTEFLRLRTLSYLERLLLEFYAKTRSRVHGVANLYHSSTKRLGFWPENEPKGACAGPQKNYPGGFK